LLWSTALFVYLFACYGLGAATTLIVYGERQGMLVLLIGACVALTAVRDPCFWGLS
jgi:hypothetical protein